MDNLKQKVGAIRLRLSELLASNEPDKLRVELFWLDHALGELVEADDETNEPSRALATPLITPDQLRDGRMPFVSSERNLILLVDENAEARRDLVRQLSEDFDIVEASDGSEAWEKAVRLKPDVIVADLQLPSTSGSELCRKLRATVDTSHVGIILLSSLAEREYIIFGLESGADEFLAKPCDPAILRARINSLLRRRMFLREEVVASHGRPQVLEYKTQLDKAFMGRIFCIIEKHLANTDFSVADLCHELAMSRSSVYNKIKSLTGTGPNDIVRIMRLSRAKEMLSNRPYPISEVATKVGFSDPKYFSTCFKKEYGISPSKLNDNKG